MSGSKSVWDCLKDMTLTVYGLVGSEASLEQKCRLTNSSWLPGRIYNLCI